MADSIFVVGSKKCIFSAFECISAIQGHPGSKILVPAKSVQPSFLSCTVSDIPQIICWNLQIFPTLLSCSAPLRMFPLEVRCVVYHEETSHTAILKDRIVSLALQTSPFLNLDNLDKKNSFSAV